MHLKIIQELHNEGHVGRDRTLCLVSDSFYWPTLRKVVSRIIDCCHVCQVSKGTTTNWTILTLAYTPLSLGKILVGPRPSHVTTSLSGSSDRMCI